MKVIQSTPAVLILALICALHSLNGLPLSNKEGTVIDVAILEIENTRIQIRLQNGSSTWLDRDRLSSDSHQAIIDLARQDQSRFQIINELLGIPLLKDNNLWDDAPTEVAQRLEWPLESQTETQSSFRYYPPATYQILEARPYSSVIYGAENQAALISIVFANKGDFKFSSPPSKDEIKAMQAAIEDDTLSHASATRSANPKNNNTAAAVASNNSYSAGTGTVTHSYSPHKKTSTSASE